MIGNAAIALTLAGCTSTTVSPSTTGEVSEAEVSEAGELQVVTTFLPMTYFTEAVAGDRATVTQLLPLNADPHDYQATPTDIQLLADADVLVENGLGLELFLDSLVENAANADLVVIDTSEGIPVIANEEDGHDHGAHDHGDHDHDHGEHSHDDHDHEGEAHAHGDEHDHEEAHSDEGSGEGAHDHAHDHGPNDPHVWLSPEHAIQQVENIRDGLIAADPEGEEIYTANAAAYIEDLEALDLDISKQLEPYAGQSFVTYHDFAAYFARSYDLESEHLVSLPEGSPSPEDVQRVIDTVKAANLEVLLTEPAQSGNAFGALASDLDISVSVFDPLESTGESELDPADYIEKMAENSDNLAAAFGGDKP